MNNVLTKTEVLDLLKNAYGFADNIEGVLWRVGQISDDYFELESGDDWMAFHYTGATLVAGTATFKPRNSMYLDKVSFTVLVVATEGPKAEERDEAVCKKIPIVQIELRMPDGSSATMAVPEEAHIEKYIDAIKRLLAFTGFQQDTIEAYLGDN